jgi:hypothetical protein
MRRPAGALPIGTQDQAAAQAILAGASRRGNPTAADRYRRHPPALDHAFVRRLPVDGGILGT